MRFVIAIWVYRKTKMCVTAYFHFVVSHNGMIRIKIKKELITEYSYSIREMHYNGNGINPSNYAHFKNAGPVSVTVISVRIQGGSNMTGTNCDLFTHKSSRSYLNHLVLHRLPIRPANPHNSTLPIQSSAISHHMSYPQFNYTDCSEYVKLPSVLISCKSTEVRGKHVKTD
jgi:hypothetical protein